MSREDEKINTKLSPDNKNILSDLATVFAPNTAQAISKAEWQNIYIANLLEAFATYLEKFSDTASDQEDLVILPKSLATAFTAEIAPLVDWFTKCEQISSKNTRAKDISLEYKILHENYPMFKKIYATKDLYEKIEDNNYATHIMHKMVKNGFDKLSKMADERESKTNDVSIEKDEKAK